jgi:hypothetical protein
VTRRVGAGEGGKEMRGKGGSGSDRWVLPSSNTGTIRGRDAVADLRVPLGSESGWANRGALVGRAG